MTAPTIKQMEQAAVAYEETLVPALFHRWAEVVAAHAGLTPGQRVLDVACGTGVLARAAASQVGSTGTVVGLDVNPGMLQVARDQAPSIRWEEGRAESLPFEPASFDAVLSQFGLMFFQDRRRALTEMHRVLAPGGSLSVAVLGSLDEIPAYAILAGVIHSLVGHDVADLLRAPFALGDPPALEYLFREAGIAAPVVHTHSGPAEFPSVRDMVLADVQSWFPLAGVHLKEAVVEDLVTDAEMALERYVEPEGRVQFEVTVHVVTARRD